MRAIESMKRKDALAAEATPDPQEQLTLAASRLADALERRRPGLSAPDPSVGCCTTATG